MRWQRLACALADSQRPLERRLRLFLSLELFLKLLLLTFRRRFDLLLKPSELLLPCLAPAADFLRAGEWHEVWRIQRVSGVFVRPDIAEKGKALVIVHLRDGIELVVVAAGASHC